MPGPDEDQLNASLSCPLASICSGCDRLHLNRAGLEADRVRALRALGFTDVPIDFAWIQAGKLRDRLEFSLEPTVDAHDAHRFGLFDKERTQIVDIENCPQLSTPLQTWLRKFREDLPRVPARRTVRLRVAPDGTRGVWLDFANEDIRDLLDEEKWLSRQLEKAIVVEVGQRRKRVVLSSEGPRAHRLADATLDAWFTTPLKEKDASLFGTIGTFTQPGFEAQKTLVRVMLNHANLNGDRDASQRHIAEFGAGIGAFTLPLLATGARVDVFESDRLALAALEKGVAMADLDAANLKIHAGDFILSARHAEAALEAEPNTIYDLVVVDPPRPGLGKFIDAIASRAREADWVYISCYPESFAKDAAKLAEKGLVLERITIVEQFPFTRHFEIVASFRRATK